MKWNKRFKYPASSIRSVINGGRHYDIGTEKLPSVTTILQATQSPKRRRQYWLNGSRMLAKLRQIR
jgi:hypothetical protein